MTIQLVADSENVVRILSHKWVIDGIIMHTAFTLRENETYISVNRPSISSYQDDVRSFVSTHPVFYADNNYDSYFCAFLNVGNIRSMNVKVDGKQLNANVEVEPRDLFTKSHAGIFTRYNGVNLKKGNSLATQGLDKDVSADDILLEVRDQLLDMASLEQCELPNVD